MKHSKSSIITVSRQSVHNKKYSSIKKKQSNSLIHVTIGLPRLIMSTNNHQHSISNNEQKISINQKQSRTNTKKSSSQNSGFTGKTHLTQSSKVSYYQNIINNYNCQTRTEVSDKNDTINDYHKISKQNKKIKCSRRCFVASLIIGIIVVLITVAILLALFIKSKKTISSTPINVLRWNKTAITVAGSAISFGSASNQLFYPRDVILDHENNLYVVDTSNHRVQKFLFGNLIGQTVVGTGVSGQSQSQLNGPLRAIMDSNGDFYVSDYGNSRIQFWRNGAKNGTTVAGITSTPGNTTDLLDVPYGIALNPSEDTLYIVDYNNHRIMSYASGVHNGTLVFGGIGPGMTNTQLYYPVGLQFDAVSNSLIIANHAVHNIVRYVLGAQNWTLVAGTLNGVSGNTATTFNAPLDMTFDPMGNMYVADRSNHRIQFFYAGQSNGSTIAGITGINGSNVTTLNWPWSVELDSQLNVYVADSNNHRIQKFLRY